MNQMGNNQGTSGNVSVRLPDDPRQFLITPSGIPYQTLRPEMIVRMDIDGGYYGSYLPSSEWRMHLDLYRAHERAAAVVHTHATFATILSCLRVDIPSFHYMVVAGGGADIRCARYATFGTQALSDNMLKAIRDRKACLLANHGMICFESSLPRALRLAAEVEELSHQYYHARLIGEPKLLSAAEMRKVQGMFRSYGKQPHELKVGEDQAFEPPVRRDP